MMAKLLFRGLFEYTPQDSEAIQFSANEMSVETIVCIVSSMQLRNVHVSVRRLHVCYSPPAPHVGGSSGTAPFGAQTKYLIALTFGAKTHSA